MQNPFPVLYAIHKITLNCYYYFFQIELRNTDFFNAISSCLKCMTTNMGSLPLLIAQAAFQEDQGHWHENEGFPITHFTFLLEKLRFLESFFLNFSKRDITKTWTFECRFQRSMFKNVRSSSVIRQY